MTEGSGKGGASDRLGRASVRLGTPRRSGRVLIIESWANGGAPMSALEPTPVANLRIWALPPVARRGLSWPECAMSAVGGKCGLGGLAAATTGIDPL